MFESNLQRLTLQGIEPLELWDMTLGKQTLWDRMASPDFASALLEALHLIKQGKACSRSDGPLTGRLRDISRVMIGGGRAKALQAAQSWHDAPVPVHFDDAGFFVAEAGGLDLLPAHGGLILDLGQTAIKVMLAGKRVRYERDLAALPIAPAPAHGVQQLEQLKAFVRRAIQASCAGHADERIPADMVIALPCEIAPDGTPGGSSYGGLKGSKHFIPELLTDLVPGAWRVSLLNDAELAAHSMRLKRPVRDGQTALVLTVGFGVGAALVSG